MRRKLLSAVIIITMMITIFPASTAFVDASTSNYTIGLNKRYVNCYRSGSSHLMKFKFTVPSSGWVKPVLYMNAEKNYNFIGWSDGIYDLSLNNCYSEYDNSTSVRNYEDSNGHKWNIYNFDRCRLPAGTYYFYMGDPGSALNEYGTFDLILNYKSESSSTSVEKEFNDSRNKANSVICNKTYYGVNHSRDVDYFKFSLRSTTKTSLYLYQPETSGNIGSSFEPRIVNSSGTTVGYSEYLGTVEFSNGIKYKKYLFNNMLSAGTYYFRVSNFYDTTYDYQFIVSTTPGKVNNLKLSRPKSKTVKISFSAASKATKYQIYRKKSGGKWSLVKTTSSRSWTNKKLSKGKKYYFKVRAVNGEYVGNFSSTKRITVR